jgi:hypothetical protein
MYEDTGVYIPIPRPNTNLHNQSMEGNITMHEAGDVRACDSR